MEADINAQNQSKSSVLRIDAILLGHGNEVQRFKQCKLGKIKNLNYFSHIIP